MTRSPTWHERESAGQLHDAGGRAFEHRAVCTRDALSVHPCSHRPAGGAGERQGAALSVHGDRGGGGRGRGRRLCGCAVGAGERRLDHFLQQHRQK